MKNLFALLLSVVLLNGCSNRSVIKVGEGNDTTNAAINIPRAIIESNNDKSCRHVHPERKLTCQKEREAETKALADRMIKAKSREENR